jgi:hypothetical protein
MHNNPDSHYPVSHNTTAVTSTSTQRIYSPASAFFAFHNARESLVLPTWRSARRKAAAYTHLLLEWDSDPELWPPSGRRQLKPQTARFCVRPPCQIGPTVSSGHAAQQADRARVTVHTCLQFALRPRAWVILSSCAVFQGPPGKCCTPFACKLLGWEPKRPATRLHLCHSCPAVRTRCSDHAELQKLAAEGAGSDPTLAPVVMATAN